MLQPIKFVLYVENVLGLYRNFLFLGKISRTLACIRTVLEISCMMTSFFMCLPFENAKSYFVLAHSYSLFAIVLSWYHSKKFKDIIMHLYTCSEYFPEYTGLPKRRTRILVCLLVNFSIFTIVGNVYYCSTYMHVSATAGLPIPIYILFQCIFHACDFRFIVEFAVVWTVFLSISDQLNCIAQSIKEEINIKRQKNCIKSNNCINMYKDVKVFGKWSATYEIMEKTSKLCNDVFYLQLSFMISLVVVTYIVLMYDAIYENVSGRSFALTQVLYVTTLSHFYFALYMVSNAAQKIQNSGNLLKQLLGRFLIIFSSGELQYRCTKDLLRVVTTHPIRMKVFGSTAGMALLPACIAFSTSYLVISLQFNNVV